MEKVVHDAYCVEGFDIVYREPEKIIREFMLKLTEQISVEMERRMKFAGHAAFLSNQNQLLIVVAQAAAKVTDTFLLKPTSTGTRRPAKWEVFTGVDCDVDLWVMYNGVTFLINISHDMMSVASRRIKKKTICKWNDSLARFEDAVQEAKECRLHHGLIIRVGLQILPLYQTVRDENESLIDDSYIISNIRRKLYENLNPIPNWSARWLTGLEAVYEYEDRKEMYPAVVFLGNIKQISDNNKTNFNPRIDPIFKIRKSRRKIPIGGMNTYYKYHRLVSVKPDVQTF